MKVEKLSLFLLLFLCLIISGIYSQEVSEKKDVSVFNVSYYGWRFPELALGSLDSTIRKVFVDMGRFRVLEVRKRFLEDNDLYEFMDRIKDIKEQEVEIPEEVSFGHVIFTEADFNSLISSFIVIIPEVTFYDLNEKYNKDKKFIGYEVSLKTSYTILDANTMEIVAKPEITTSGYSEDKQEVWQDAIEMVPSQLEFELKKIPIFTLKTGVLEVHRGTVTIEKGNNMGIYKGFEFEIIQTETLASGFSKEKSAGLILVNSVYEEISEATVLYGHPKEGDQLVEIPRMGADGILYVHVLSNPPFETFSILPGLEIIWSRGLYFAKPIIGIEVPFADLHEAGASGYMYLIQNYGFPLNIYGGCSLNIYKRRLQISPTGVIGATAIMPYDENDVGGLTHLGFKGYLSLNYLFHRDMKLTLDIGYSQWYALAPGFLTYGGILAGLQFVYKS